MFEVGDLVESKISKTIGIITKRAGTPSGWVDGNSCWKPTQFYVEWFSFSINKIVPATWCLPAYLKKISQSDRKCPTQTD